MRVVDRFVRLKTVAVAVGVVPGDTAASTHAATVKVIGFAKRHRRAPVAVAAALFIAGQLLTGGSRRSGNRQLLHSAGGVPSWARCVRPQAAQPSPCVFHKAGEVPMHGGDGLSQVRTVMGAVAPLIAGQLPTGSGGPGHHRPCRPAHRPVQQQAAGQSPLQPAATTAATDGKSATSRRLSMTAFTLEFPSATGRLEEVMD